MNQVLRELNDKLEYEGVRLCRTNLAKYRSGFWRLCDIIIGDETWIYHRQIGRKATNKSWVDEGELPTTMVRRSRFEPKRLFSIFFKSNGSVLINCVDEGKIIDHNYII